VDINTDYKLTNLNYYEEIYEKKQIIIGSTLSVGMNHYDLWGKKINGKFKGIYHYTIGLNGIIYNHFDPKFYSTPLNLKDYDNFIISIALENEGWLAKDFNKNELITWSGDIYKRNDTPIEIKWRGKLRWAPYSEKQMDSLIKLCIKLAKDFNIPLKTVNHNTKIDNISKKRGIYYRSNYTINYLDVSPAFNFETFKNKIEG
jgi:hypothetical protein